MKFPRSVLLFSLLITSVGCSSSVPDVETKKAKSNVTVTEENGVVTAKLSPDAENNQQVVASSKSDVADSSILIPPGALAIETEVSVGLAQDNAAGLLTENGYSGEVVTKGAPLFAATLASDPPALGKPMTLALPLPDLESKGFSLAGAKLVLVYLVMTEDGWVSGIKALTAENLKGMFVTAEMAGFGYFQIAYLATEVEDNEVTTTSRPGLDHGSDD